MEKQGVVNSGERIHIVSTNFKRLECSTGCCRDKLLFLAEQVYREQDDIINQSLHENIELGNFVSDYILPYLENRAVSGDHAAQDILIDLNQLVVPRG